MIDFIHDEGFKKDDYTGHYEFWLDLDEPEERSVERVKYLEDRHWIDHQTEHVMVELLIYNGQLEPLLCEVILDFELHRSGWIEPKVMIETIPAIAYQNHRVEKIAFEAVYVTIVLISLIDQVKKIAASVGSFGLGTAVKRHFLTEPGSFSHGVSALGVVFGFVLIGVWVPFVLELDAIMGDIANLHRPKGFQDYTSAENTQGWIDYHHKIVHIEHEVSIAIKEMQMIRYLGGANVFLSLFAFISTWIDIPALRVVAQTLKVTLKNLAGFGVILCCLVGLFAASGMLMFGQVMDQFHTFQESVITTLIVFFTANTAVYMEQRKISEIFAALWMILMIIIMFFVVVNMVLAIIVDAYQEALECRSPHDVSLLQTAMDSAQVNWNNFWHSIRCQNHAQTVPVSADVSQKQSPKSSGKPLYSPPEPSVSEFVVQDL
jgi:predicted nucleic acid-binding protein